MFVTRLAICARIQSNWHAHMPCPASAACILAHERARLGTRAVHADS